LEDIIASVLVDGAGVSFIKTSFSVDGTITSSNVVEELSFETGGAITSSNVSTVDKHSFDNGDTARRCNIGIASGRNFLAFEEE